MLIPSHQGVIVDLPTMTDKDISDIVDFGVKNDVDFVAASFVRKASDVSEIRRVLEEAITEIQEGVYSKKEVDEEAQSQITDTVVGRDGEKEEGVQAEVHSNADNTDTSLVEEEKDGDEEEEGKKEEDTAPKSEEGGKKEKVEESNATTFSA